jgi:hypothetical protein
VQTGGTAGHTWPCCSYQCFNKHGSLALPSMRQADLGSASILILRKAPPRPLQHTTGPLPPTFATPATASRSSPPCRKRAAMLS